MTNFKEHDIVYVKFELSEDGRSIPKYTHGTIVHVYSEFAYVVEFFVDSNAPVVKTVIHDQIYK